MHLSSNARNACASALLPALPQAVPPTARATTSTQISRTAWFMCVGAVADNSLAAHHHDLAVAAVASARLHSPSLVPYVLYVQRDRAGDACNTSLCRRLRALGARVIPWTLSFLGDIPPDRRVAGSNRQLTVAAYGRLDVPLAVHQLNAEFKRNALRTDVVLYTDTDVQFTGAVDALLSLAVPVLAAGTEVVARPFPASSGRGARRVKTLNSGVMLLNVTTFLLERPAMLHYAARRSWRFKSLDQTWLRDWFENGRCAHCRARTEGHDARSARPPSVNPITYLDDAHWNARAFMHEPGRSNIWHWHGYKPQDVRCWHAKPELRRRQTLPSAWQSPGRRSSSSSKSSTSSTSSECRVFDAIVPTSRCAWHTYTQLLDRHDALLRWAKQQQDEGASKGGAHTAAAAANHQRRLVEAWPASCGRGPPVHLLFLLSMNWGTSVMRGTMSHSVMQQRHLTPSTVCWLCSKCARKPSFRFKPQLEQLAEALASAKVAGTRPVCICVKFCPRAAVDLCTAHGAATIWDVIDNFRLFASVVVQREWIFANVTAFATQTLSHARWLQGITRRKAFALPHPHGNVGGWSIARSPPTSVRGVGLVYSDAQANAPPPRVAANLAEACCAAGATLYMVHSRSDGGISMRAMPCRGRRSSPALAASSISSCGGNYCSAQNATGGDDDTATTAGSPPLLRDETGQQRFYDSSELLSKIQVGLAWSFGATLPPGFGGDAAKRFDGHRPSTRLAWWWSHGLPTLARRTPTFAERVASEKYPASALVSGPQELEEALRHLVSCQRARSCLHQAALRAARRSSPEAAARRLVRMACSVSA